MGTTYPVSRIPLVTKAPFPIFRPALIPDPEGNGSE